MSYSFSRWFFESSPDSIRNWIFRGGEYRSTVTASGEQPHRNQTCGVVHRLRAIATDRVVARPTTSFLDHCCRASLVSTRLRNDGKETVDETTLTTFFFVPEGRSHDWHEFRFFCRRVLEWDMVLGELSVGRGSGIIYLDGGGDLERLMDEKLRLKRLGDGDCFVGQDW